MKRVINKTTEWVLIALMSLLLITVLWQIISRYMLNDPSAYTDELAGYLLVWLGLLGAAYVTGQKGHLSIDYLIQKLSLKRYNQIQIFTRGIIFLFAFVVLVIGGSWLVYTRFSLEVTSAALNIPLGYIYLVTPISGVLISYYASDEVVSILKKQA